jgi:hypothetical protein
MMLLEVQAPETSGHITIRNTGGSLLSWTASTTTPDLITLGQTSGQVADEGIVPFSVDVGKRDAGTYRGYINIDAGAAGSRDVEVVVKVAEELYDVFLPISRCR